MKERPLTGGQIRAARAFLRWSADELARASSVGVATIRRAELAEGDPTMNAPNDRTIRLALEAAGIVFIDGNGEGVGVRLKHRHSSKK